MVMPENKYHDVYPAIDPAGKLQGATKDFHVAITGASRGCGRCMAVAFAKAGASKLFLFGRDQKSLAETARVTGNAGHECKIFTYSLDLSKDNVDEPFQKMLQDADGRVDVLINNAGVLETWKPLNDSDPAEWWRSFEVNIRGTYLGVKAVLPSMLKHKGGTVINLSSAGGLSTRAGASAYQTCKSDIMRFTAFLDVDHGEQGIRTFALHPGAVQTDLAFCMPEFMHKILVDTPELSGAVCVYLATKEADYLRGRYVSACWDLPQLQHRKDEILEKDLFKLRLAVD
ncbi:hypothetical protein WJX73_000053 [Symbiochloris irregularis]|uniref:Uncharacterized protein n=1 Tax=Symbiochloris irregularis TaxID=706552 RepID=A0AAW1PI86_9CHLO